MGSDRTATSLYSSCEAAMFHLYFGAFDLVLYAGGFYVALVFANALTEERTTLKAITLAEEEEAFSTLALRPAASDVDLSQLTEAEETTHYELIGDA